MISKEQKRKIQNKIGSALSNLALVISVIICISVVTQVMTNGYAKIGGISLFRIVTGSMEPEIPVGSLIICQETDIEQIQVNDIVCFRSLSSIIKGKTVTHRVIDVTQNSEGEVLLITRGDANLAADTEYVTRNNLIGRVNYYSKETNIMASFVNILTDRIGFLILILMPTLLIAGFILRSCMMNIRKELDRLVEENKQKEQEKSQLYTTEEYAAMLERIKSELVEEMKHDVEESKGSAEEISKTE